MMGYNYRRIKKYIRLLSLLHHYDNLMFCIVYLCWAFHVHTGFNNLEELMRDTFSGLSCESARWLLFLLTD